MNGILIRRSGEIIGRWMDPAAQSIPPGLIDASLVELDDAAYAQVPESLWQGDAPAYLWDGSAIQPIVRQRWYAIARISDRAVVALDTNNSGALPPAVEYVEVARADWGAVSADAWMDDGSPAWTCQPDGAVSRRADTRPVLRVTQSGNGRAAVGELVTFDFQLEDAAGVSLGFTGSRPVTLVVDGKPEPVELALTNGQRQVQKSFAAKAVYEIRSADPSVYRVAGDTRLEVGEAW